MMVKHSTTVKINAIQPLDDQKYSETENGQRKTWLVLRLIEKAKDMPIHEMPMVGLNTCDLFPKSDSMNDFVSHMQKVAQVDMSHPIILDDEGYVMDGRHRIARALLDGHETIKFVRFETTPLPDYTEAIK